MCAPRYKFADERECRVGMAVEWETEENDPRHEMGALRAVVAGAILTKVSQQIFGYSICIVKLTLQAKGLTHHAAVTRPATALKCTSPPVGASGSTVA